MTPSLDRWLRTMRTRTRPRPTKLTSDQQRERVRVQDGLRQDLERLLVKHRTTEDHQRAVGPR